MILAFVPVIHKGYLELFKKYPESLGIFGTDIIADYTALTRDCRTVNPGLIKKSLDALGILSHISVISKADLTNLAHANSPIVMPDEDVSHAIAKQYGFTNVMYESIFLRWDGMPTNRKNTVSPDRTILRDEFSREMMSVALSESEKSADWWRHVGTAIVKNGHIIATAHNSHLPTNFHLAQNGDPRTNFNAGERIDLSTAIHSEALAVAQSAKKGIALDGAEAFITTFPCPNCARLLAEAGIKRLYYTEGYSLLDAEDVLKAYGVTLVQVTLPDPTNEPN